MRSKHLAIPGLLFVVFALSVLPAMANPNVLATFRCKSELLDAGPVDSRAGDHPLKYRFPHAATDSATYQNSRGLQCQIPADVD